MKRKQTLFRLTLVIAVLASVSIAMAVIPPPPVDQNLGLYDTVCAEFNESDCRSCHSSGVPDAHHMLVEEGKYGCTDCHPPGPDGGVTVTRDCTVCHTSTPHHETDAAIDRHCSECHGSFVDDFDDGHYIPTYNVSLITPTTKYRVKNETTGKKWGGCEACHEPDPSMDPVIESNSVTHHTAVYNMTCGANNNICHLGPEPTIRKCEDCHGVNSIHNIQYDYENTKGELGYGHIGDNWDCMGCHAWYEAYKGLPMEDVITPNIDEMSVTELVVGEETKVAITGSNFVNKIDGTTHTSTVAIDNGQETIKVTPDSITASEMIVTIPPQEKGTFGLYLEKSDKKSNKLPFVVAPAVKIDSATMEGRNLVISGSGFGECKDGFSEFIRVTIKPGNRGSTTLLETEVVSWSDEMVVVSCDGTRPRGLATVYTQNGHAEVRIMQTGAR